MLVLSRKPQESIVIGEDVTVTVIDVTRSRVRLGIQAPKEVTVHRRELRQGMGQTPTPPPAKKPPCR
jgi:carbon storage regulator